MRDVQSFCFANLNLLIFFPFPLPSPWSLFKGDVIRDRDSQKRFLAQHSVATLLRYCFEWLQHCRQCVALKIIVANRPVKHHLNLLYTGIKVTSRKRASPAQYNQAHDSVGDGTEITNRRARFTCKMWSLSLNLFCLFVFFLTILYMPSPS